MLLAEETTENRILFVSDRDGISGNNESKEIYIMNPDGTNVKRLTNNYAYDAEPCWSPDGKRVAFISERTGNRDIYLMDMDGNNQVALIKNGSSLIESDPAWGPKIAFSAYSDSLSQIYTINPDGTELNQLTATTMDCKAPSWSPDGQKIAYECAGEIYIMNADGSNPVNLTNDPYWDSEPVRSFDGKRIAFTSERDGYDKEIYIMNADGSNPMNISQSESFDEHPSWSNDGKKIYFHIVIITI